MPTHRYRHSIFPFSFKPKHLALALGFFFTNHLYAGSLSYAEAEQQALKVHTVLKPTKHYSKHLN